MKKLLLLPIMMIGLALTSCQTTARVKLDTGPTRKVHASWYECCARTANGERFNPNGLTAAHKKLRFGTRVRVSYKGKSVVVRINDRGPFVRGRELDLARGAARKIGCHGTCVVDMTILK